MMNRYLYVEDDPLSREIMRTTLEHIIKPADYAIFSDSADFLVRLASLAWIPDIILLDIHMKPLSGIELLSLLRQQALYKHARIVAMTASVMNGEVNQLKQAGFDGGIGKPIDVEMMHGLMQRILNGDKVWHI